MPNTINRISKGRGRPFENGEVSVLLMNMRIGFVTLLFFTGCTSTLRIVDDHSRPIHGASVEIVANFCNLTVDDKTDASGRVDVPRELRTAAVEPAITIEKEGYWPYSSGGHRRQAVPERITLVVRTNILRTVSIDDIKFVSFHCSATQFQGDCDGLYFSTETREEIESLVAAADNIDREDWGCIGCGNLTKVIFHGSDNSPILEAFVNMTGHSVSVTRHSDGNTMLITGRGFALCCFDLMQKHSPEILQEMKRTEWSGRRLFMKAFPVDKIEQNN